jgi:signal peptidase I
MNQDPTPVPPDAVRAGHPSAEQFAAGPSPNNRPPAASPRVSSATEVKDGTREIVETIVFVVVLVLLLKTFLAEAFVIPTGSMATTLLGYHKNVACDQCRFPFQVNASDEVERKPPDLVIEWTCPNCRYRNRSRLAEGLDP